MVRRTGWWVAAVLLSLAQLHDAGAAAQQDDAFLHNHRELLDFNAASSDLVSEVVAGVTADAATTATDVVDDVVDTITSGLSNGNRNTPAPSALSPTPSPSSQDDITPETPAPNDAETPSPSEDVGSQTSATPSPDSPEPSAETPAETPTPEAAASVDTGNSIDNPLDDPIDNPDAGSSSSGSGSGKATKTPRKQSDIAGVDALAESGSGESQQPGASEPTLEENVIIAAPSSTGASTAPALEENVIIAAPSSTGASTAPALEENVITAAPSSTGASTAPALEENVITAAPSAAPNASASSSAVQLPISKSDGNSPATTPSSDAGQVHAASYSGSLSSAVQGVGKNSEEPSPSATRRPRKPKKSEQAAGSASQPEDAAVESSSTSSGSIYSMGTSSILSIVGVIVGICAILVLFVVISRKKYGDESDDELPIAYGYRIDGGSVVRLSPTFLHNGESSMIGYPPNNYDHDNTSSSGESGEEKVPYFGNSIGFDNYQAHSHLMDGGAMAASYPKQSEGFPSIYSSVRSENSESWSSVLESDCDQSNTSRCTRDTTLSGLTTPQNSESGRSGNSRSTYGDEMSDTSSNYRSTSASSLASFGRDTLPEEGYDSCSTAVSLDASQQASGTVAAPPRSTAANSFYRTSSIARSSGYSDYNADGGRSTGASSIYSVGSPSPFDV